MTDSGDNDRNFRKIAIAFDPAFSTPALLEAAADLAVAFGAELEALFVEDSDIASLSGLPFAKLFEAGSGRAVRFDSGALAARRAGPVARQRMALRQLSKRHRFTYTVREVTGHALAAAAEGSTAELIVIAARHSKFGGTAQDDEEAMKVASTARRSVLLASRFPISAERVLVVAGDNDIGRRAGHVAERIARRAAAGGAPVVERLSAEGLTRDALAAKIASFSPTLLVVGAPDAQLIAEACDRPHAGAASVLIVR